MIQLFLKKSLPSVKMKIDYATCEWLKKIALKNLGIDSMNKLRDRFEGQSYLDNFLTRSYVEIAFEKYINVEFLDRSKKETLKNYFPNLILNGQRVSLFSFTLEDYPKIAKKDFDIGVFALVNVGARTVEFLGFLDSETILKMTETESLSPMVSKFNHGLFKTFDELLPINALSL